MGNYECVIYSGPTPDRSSSLDQDLLIHELTHGLSNRLHGNAAGLSTNMSRGMSEGWSDFYARALLATADENVNGVYASGGVGQQWTEPAPTPTTTTTVSGVSPTRSRRQSGRTACRTIR